MSHLAKTNLEQLKGSELAARWAQSAANRPVVVLLPFSNQTGQQIGTALDAILMRMESALVNDFAVDVVSLESRPELVKEIRAQQAEGYDPRILAGFGEQAGAQFVVSGKVVNAAQAGARARYQLVVQVMEGAGGDVAFEHISALRAEDEE